MKRTKAEILSDNKLILTTISKFGSITAETIWYTICTDCHMSSRSTLNKTLRSLICQNLLVGQGQRNIQYSIV